MQTQNKILKLFVKALYIKDFDNNLFRQDYWYQSLHQFKFFKLSSINLEI
jgi:hypothetical protein